ncbi:MAG: (E)-4-hydroxy-3-methylbut-2-enyl-diphosphate synthase [Candidatus Omnitrophota bacterium]|jgi:(E)-4-hydroxy-3-methylbut-2-enyl-diphosphate synthase
MGQTRVVDIRGLKIGGDNPIAVQSMCATRTKDIEATMRQVQILEAAGADLIRIAVDNQPDVEALKQIRQNTTSRLVVDLQENYLLAETVAPFVDKMRYNPGHLHHLKTNIPIRDKVKWLVDVAKKHNCALRVGVNCGSVAPDFLEKYPNDHVKAIVESAAWHCDLMDEFGFTNFVVSLKDSDPKKVILCNEEFSKRRPEVPIHLGVTEAGLPPDGIIKTRIAFENLLNQGIGNTLRVSLTVPNDDKAEEIRVGHAIIDDVKNGRFLNVPKGFGDGLNVISCPSCSRVENGAFVNLAQDVKKMSEYAQKHKLTIAVMGCRVNGPGETDDADLGLWCGPSAVTLKQKTATLGTYSYTEILPVLKSELDKLVAAI